MGTKYASELMTVTVVICRQALSIIDEGAPQCAQFTSPAHRVIAETSDCK